MSRSRYRSVVFYVLVILVVAIAFYAGGVVGFAQGFQTGNDIAQIAAGQKVVAVLRRSGDNSAARSNAVLLESIVDDAVTSYDTKRRLGGSPFDVMGVNELDSTVEAMMSMIIDYRRHHPSPLEEPQRPSVPKPAGTTEHVAGDGSVPTEATTDDIRSQGVPSTEDSQDPSGE